MRGKVRQKNEAPAVDTCQLGRYVKCKSPARGQVKHSLSTGSLSGACPLKTLKNVLQYVSVCVCVCVLEGHLRSIVFRGMSLETALDVPLHLIGARDDFGRTHHRK